MKNSRITGLEKYQQMTANLGKSWEEINKEEQGPAEEVQRLILIKYGAVPEFLDFLSFVQFYVLR